MFDYPMLNLHYSPVANAQEPEVGSLAEYNSLSANKHNICFFAMVTRPGTLVCRYLSRPQKGMK